MNAFIILGIVGPTEVILIIAIVVLLFGGKKIPELMKGIGKGAREFKRGVSGEYDDEGSKKENITTKD